MDYNTRTMIRWYDVRVIFADITAFCLFHCPLVQKRLSHLVRKRGKLANEQRDK